MNAQEAARMVNSGMEKLSLAQLVEVHAVLKGDENSAGLFRLVSGYARGQLSVYARSTEDFQSQMTLEDAGALRELAEEVGFDKDDNLTKDGQKALEIAARVSKRAKDKKVEEAVAAAKEQPDKEENRLESISLTPEQIKYLDEKGIVHNGTLESIAWFKDRDEAMKILADAGAKPEETPRAPIAEIEEDNVAENVNENNLGSVDISKNMQQLEMLSASVNPLDENDKSFADNRASLNVLDVYDEKGVKHDVKSELVEQAKLRTEAEMLDAKKVTKEEYVERLKLNIDSAVYSVVTGNAVDFSHYNGNREHLQQVLKNKIDVLAKAEGGSKPSKAHVRLESVLGFMAVESARIDSKIEKIEKAVGSIPVIQKFKAKIKKFDERCEQKFGPKTWGYVRGAALVAEKAAPAIGMAFVAGMGGPLGIGVYAAYVVKKHVVPFTNKYMAQPKEQRTGFRKFCKENKKDAVLAGLYAASAGLSAGMAVYGAVSNLSVAAAEAASAGQTLDTAAKASLLTRHVGVAKMSLSGAAMLTRSATSVYEAHKAGDKKECNRRLLIGLGSAVAFAGGIWARDMLGKWLGEGKEDTHTEPNPENAGAQNGNGDEGAAVQPGNDNQNVDNNAPNHETPDAVVQYDDFYHGPEVEARSKESVIRLLTNSQVSRSEATLKAEMMIYRVGHMDESVRTAFPSASDAQIAHAILLRAADVRKGDADELLRALLGDGSCSKLTMEQQVSEIHKGLTGYNYGQRTDLPYGRNLDPNYVGINTRSRFLLDDCASERLVDYYDVKEEPVETVAPVTREGTKPDELPVQPGADKPNENPQPLPEQKETEQPETPQPIIKSPKAGKPFEGKDTLAGGRDQINRLAELGVARYNDGKFRYVDYDEHYKMLRQHGFEDGRAQEIVKNRIAVEQKELENLKTRSK
ncbi:MAG: hypothetical protein V8R25_03015 [Alphaproteobacteria bacterium]